MARQTEFDAILDQALSPPVTTPPPIPTVENETPSPYHKAFTRRTIVAQDEMTAKWAYWDETVPNQDPEHCSSPTRGALLEYFRSGKVMQSRLYEGHDTRGCPVDYEEFPWGPPEIPGLPGDVVEADLFILLNHLVQERLIVKSVTVCCATGPSDEYRCIWSLQV